MTSTFWKGQVLSKPASFGPLCNSPALSHLIGLICGADVNIETPGMCGHMLQLLEKRPGTQLRKGDIPISPQ